ncbi:MAG: YgiQ family radical SAM protein [Bacteroidales bacterium]|nr:YgiQ family radical SAM protein [Bacteroidales bacterium]MCK9497992.1 YgiQ family radical SAM protein [Bacteroidales bacterium]MDY0314720.1 YgiQ family radical SAM protein [Bacteroidales bacterium]
MVNKNILNTKLSFPSSKKEMQELGWETADIILVSGDAFIDHPSFGTAVIARVLENEGFKVAVIPQPNWQDDLRDFKKLGKPNLFFGISAGNMDSMINHYTAAKRKRTDDAYTPGGKSGQRPDYASNVYSNILKQIYPDTPVILGGIEASMRRFAHYDFWQDKILKSILISSNADLLVYGMAEKSIREIAKQINETGSIFSCYNIRQCAYIGEIQDKQDKDIELFSYEEVLKDKIKYGKNFVKIENETNYHSDRRITQIIGDKKIIVNPAFPSLSESEIDEIYDLPYTRLAHPRYDKKQAIPAYEMIKNSVNIHRGCFGACSFCTIAAHQGKNISSRSQKSILQELEKISEMPNFTGHITDIGGPSANMYKMQGLDLKICETCKRASCIFPNICKNLNTSHEELINLYKNSLKIKGIKKISIGSGIRYDIALYTTKNPKINKINQEYLELLISKFVSGRLKVAPEHSEAKVLKLMRKTPFSGFKNLRKIFFNINDKYELNQQIIPYFISSHPGCTEADMAKLTKELKSIGYKPEQVQSFTPTPMTLATVMYYTGINPYTGEKLYVAKSQKEKDKQLSYFFWYTAKNKIKNTKKETKNKKITKNINLKTKREKL